MNREKAKALLPVITAYANGEIIQIDMSGVWVDANINLTFNDPADAYRIKPKPRTFYGIRMVGPSCNSVAVYSSKEERDAKWLQFSTTPEDELLTLIEVLD